MTQADNDFSDFIIFVDESGDHSLTSISAEFPLFALAFCILRKTDYVTEVAPALDLLKFDTFGHDLVVLHSRDIRKQQGDFAVLRDAARRAKFMSGMSAVIAEAPFTLCVTAIDKIRHKERYRNPYNPYHLSLQYCLERAYRFLIAQEQRGKRTHIIAELRGKAEDKDWSCSSAASSTRTKAGIIISNCVLHQSHAIRLVCNWPIWLRIRSLVMCWSQNRLTVPLTS